jgi:hypothetical protein
MLDDLFSSIGSDVGIAYGKRKIPTTNRHAAQLGLFWTIAALIGFILSAASVLSLFFAPFNWLRTLSWYTLLGGVTLFVTGIARFVELYRLAGKLP